jgi:hypothetical protein
MVKEVALLAGVCVCTVPHLAAAQEAATVKAPLAALAGRTAPAIHHAPLAVAREHQDLAVRAVIDRPDLVKRATLVYRHDDRLDEVTFERSDRTDQPYVAVVPGAHVDRPSIAYAIEIERTDGPTLTVFASREDMQPVEVVGDDVDAREESLVSRLGGRRFVLQATGEYVYFGTSPAQVCPGACTASGTQPLVTRSVADQYWRTEAGFTYRLLRTVSEFGIRGGVYRGTSVVPNVSDSSQYSVGLNYGAPWLRLRVEDWLHFEGEFLTSVTEVGFSLGGGASVLLGDPYASHLTVGFEAIDVFGTRAFSRFDVTATRRFRFAPTVEVTSMPHASNAGVRLLMDVTADVGAGWSVTARGGYQARTFDSGGPAAGASLGYAF